MDLSDLSVRVAATVTTNIDCGWVRSMQSAAKGGMTHHGRDLLHCLLGRLAFRGHCEDLSHVSDSQVLSYRVMFFARRLDWPWMLKAESKLDLGVRKSCVISPVTCGKGRSHSMLKGFAISRSYGLLAIVSLTKDSLLNGTPWSSIIWWLRCQLLTNNTHKAEIEVTRTGNIQAR